MFPQSKPRRVVPVSGISGFLCLAVLRDQQQIRPEVLERHREFTDIVEGEHECAPAHKIVSSETSELSEVLEYRRVLIQQLQSDRTDIQAVKGQAVQRIFVRLAPIVKVTFALRHGN